MVSPPASQSLAPRGNRRLAYLIDNFNFSTWLLATAVLHGGLHYILPQYSNYITIISLIILSWRSLDTLFILVGLKRDEHLTSVRPGTSTAIAPSRVLAMTNPASAPSNHDKPTDGQIVLFLVSATINHPLGIFAPGVKDFIGYFGSMARAFETRRSEFGMLGSSTWVGAKERAANNDILFIYYFKTLAGVEKMVADKLHVDSVKWYQGFAKSRKYLALRHEVYHVPKGHWGNTFLNSQPTLLGRAVFDANHEATGVAEKGKEDWRSMLVSAEMPGLRSMRDRMGEGSEEIRKNGL